MPAPSFIVKSFLLLHSSIVDQLLYSVTLTFKLHGTFVFSSNPWLSLNPAERQQAVFLFVSVQNFHNPCCQLLSGSVAATVEGLQWSTHNKSFCFLGDSGVYHLSTHLLLTLLQPAATMISCLPCTSWRRRLVEPLWRNVKMSEQSEQAQTHARTHTHTERRQKK